MTSGGTPAWSRSLTWERVHDDDILFRCSVDGDAFGTVRWTGRKARDAHIRMPSGEYVLRRRGFWSPYHAILHARSESEEARLVTRWRDRLIRISHGPTYAVQHFLTPGKPRLEEWCVYDEHGEKLAHLHHARLAKEEFEVQVDVASVSIDSRYSDFILIAGFYCVLFDLVLRAGLSGLDAAAASIAISSR